MTDSAANASSKSNATTGLILGKFLPPHNGHRYLIEFAMQYVDQLTVIIETSHTEIDGQLRLRWLREMVPGCRVLELAESMPQAPDEHPSFWELWRDTLIDRHGGIPDYLFASEAYGWKLADVIGTRFVPVDPERCNLTISGTQIRQNPIEHWKHIPRVARPYFVKRVCVFGAESTGKTTLCRALADHFQTRWVPEYARVHLTQKASRPHDSDDLTTEGVTIPIEFDDIDCIARGQISSEDAIAHDANRVLICDSDLLLTEIWSETLFGRCPQWIRETARQRSYDLYLVCKPDVPWVDDPVRYQPNHRMAFHERCLRLLESHQRNVVTLSGTWARRTESAINAVNALLNSDGVSQT
jgi:NadR type nicotinamide-nucleotide adenylyltransferase